MQPKDFSKKEGSTQPGSSQESLSQEPASQEPASQELPSPDSVESSGFSGLPVPPALTPVETLQKRYADQLSQDIEQLEAQKSKLREDIQTLTRAYARLQVSVDSLKRAEQSASRAAAKRRATRAEETAETNQKTGEGDGTTQAPALPFTDGQSDSQADSQADSQSGNQSNSESDSEFVQTTPVVSPRLPGEPRDPKYSDISPAQRESATNRSIELPIPATSAQRRQLSIQSRRVDRIDSAASEKKGQVLSVIAMLLLAWHLCVVAALGTGGSWFNIPIGTLGTGFMPAVALLWLRMLVVVPALVILAPQLHEEVWNDLRDWVYSRDGLLLSLMGSGIALFISQALLYQCLGLLGAAISTALLFLYPLSAAPLVAFWRQSGSRIPTALGSLALAAIAMGGILTLKPVLDSSPTALSAIWLGVLASGAFSLYVILSHYSYRQHKYHPIPAGLVQFGVVAVLSSIVLLAKPLEPVDIDWLSFALWGILLGFLMLLVYLFNYSSLRLIGPQTSAVAAVTPLAALLLSYSFSGPTIELATIQWTGIALISLGGVALSKQT